MKLKMTQTDGKIYHVLRLEESCSYIVKMITLPEGTDRFNVIPIKWSMVFFTKLEQKFSQFVWKQKILWIAKIIALKKKNEAGGINLPDFRLYYKATVIKTVWDWHRNRNIEQWNKIESPKINSHTYGHFTFDKGGKIMQRRKDSFFNKRCWENWIATCKIMKLEHFLTSWHKSKPKWIKDLNVRPETIKLWEENIGRACYDKAFRGKYRQCPLTYITERSFLTYFLE